MGVVCVMFHPCACHRVDCALPGERHPARYNPPGCTTATESTWLNPSTTTNGKRHANASWTSRGSAGCVATTAPTVSTMSSHCRVVVPAWTPPTCVRHTPAATRSVATKWCPLRCARHVDGDRQRLTGPDRRVLTPVDSVPVRPDDQGPCRKPLQLQGFRGGAEGRDESSPLCS